MGEEGRRLGNIKKKGLWIILQHSESRGGRIHFLSLRTVRQCPSAAAGLVLHTATSILVAKTLLLAENSGVSPAAG